MESAEMHVMEVFPTLVPLIWGVKEEMEGTWEKPRKEWSAPRQGQVWLFLGWGWGDFSDGWKN